MNQPTVKMADKNLDVLEKRLSSIEKSVFGAYDKDVDYPRDAEQVAVTLSKLNSHVDSKITKKPKIEALMKRLGDLERLLDPSYTEHLTLSNDAKLELVLAEEETLRAQAAELERVRDLSSVLSSEHLKLAPTLQSRLQDLCQIHVTQQDQTGEQSEELKATLQHYNNAINLISKQFILWDEALTKLEASKHVQKADS